MKVFRALDQGKVLVELNDWAEQQLRTMPELSRVGLFGSYARNNYSPGSDIDLLLLVKQSPETVWFKRALGFDVLSLPIGADVFVYTEEEAERMTRTSTWFRHILGEVIWLGLT